MVKFPYLILGGGVAAGYAAREFVEQGVSPGQLGLLTADSALPYERPPLSKAFMAGEKDPDDILINPPDFYEHNGIELRLGTVAGRVDLDQKLVYTDGETIGFNKLMIATGARVRRFDLPGSDLQGLYFLRRLDNARDIRTAAAGSEKAVVIGGSFIGMEVAASLRQRGLDVSMVFLEEHVWQQVFSEPISEFFEDYFTRRGIKLYPASPVEGFSGQDGRLTGVRLQAGQELPADFAVAGIGVLPNTEIFANTPLQLDDGIVVNRFLEANVPDVYAVGDVARFHDVVLDKAQRFEHWDNAVAQGKLAARGMLGQREVYEHVPYFFSDVFDLSYEYWGDNRDADRVTYRGDLDTGSFSAWWLKNGHLAAAFVMDRPDEERQLAMDLILSGSPVSEADLEGDLDKLEPASAD
jgi:NADPH-dependent 2,4-dienoyl-CoA reductase/sulfur reductase-like enzyme